MQPRLAAPQRGSARRLHQIGETDLDVHERRHVRAGAPAGQEARPAVVVERRTEIGRRWIEAAAFGELRKLSLAEHRAARRRLRLAITAAPAIP